MEKMEHLWGYGKDGTPVGLWKRWSIYGVVEKMEHRWCSKILVSHVSAYLKRFGKSTSINTGMYKCFVYGVLYVWKYCNRDSFLQPLDIFSHCKSKLNLLTSKLIMVPRSTWYLFEKNVPVCDTAVVRVLCGRCPGCCLNVAFTCVCGISFFFNFFTSAICPRFETK